MQGVVRYWLPKWHEPTTLEVETRKGAKSFVAKKRKEAAENVARILVEQKKKEVAKATVEKA